MTGWALRMAGAGLLLAFLLFPESFAGFFSLAASARQPAIYTQTAVLDLTLWHLGIVAVATGLASVVGVGFAVLVTRSWGAEFLPLARAVANIGQTFPPVAVLALAVPVLGFGTAPTLVALFLYGLLPILENALAGLSAVPPSVREAARGAGMTRGQILRQVDLPLALPMILSGVRLSAVIALATATIGSTVAARTLGEVIIAGLLTGNTAFVLQGGLVVGGLALLLHDGFGALERRAARRAGLA